MRVFVAGATGAIGRPLVEQLIRQGHQVTAMVRSADAGDPLRRLGADAVQADAFDRDGVRRALAQAEADAVIDELTSLPKDISQLGAALRADSRLRIEGGGNLFAAAEALGVKRYLQQSSGFYLAARDGLADETAPMRIDAPGGTGASATMYAELERRVRASSRVRGTALRYGFLYGPGTWYWSDGSAADQARRGELAVLAGGTALWSFVHVDDAAAATVAALTAEPGTYNVVDDDPCAVNRCLPAFARWVGGPEPRVVGAEDALAAAGEEGVYYHTRLSGATNAKARAMLGFDPRPLAWKDD